MPAKKLIIFFVTCVLATTLINSFLFVIPTLAAYFCFIITSTILTIYLSLLTLFKKKPLQSENLSPLVLLGMICTYYFIQGLLTTPRRIDFMQVFLFTNLLLLFVLSNLFKTNSAIILPIFTAVTILASIEAIICLCQFFDIIDSQNKFIKITGSSVNPNVTAMFLALTLPALLTLIFQAKMFYRKVFIVAFFLVIASLMLLKCRTAFIGAVISTAIVLNFQYDIIKNIKSKLSSIKLILLIVTIAALSIFTTAYLYNLKKTSADGRMLIWKISLQMVLQRPYTGSGFGMFEHDYNLAQAKYFSKGTADANEIRNASYVYMSYNEFLQNAVEGGIIGLLLFSGFLASLLITNKTHNASAIAAKAAIVAFIAMSIFNFTVQAIPVMCLFIIYCAIVCSRDVLQLQSKKRYSSFLTKHSKVVGVCAVFFSLIICVSQIIKAKAYMQEKDASDYVKNNNFIDALLILEPLQEELTQSNTFWITYGQALLQQKQYKLAIEKFNNALTTCSNPDVFLQVAYCYQQISEYYNAKQYALMAKNIVPNRLAPDFALMKIYLNLKDTINVNRMAVTIIKAEPKVASAETNFYKQEAKIIIKK